MSTADAKIVKIENGGELLKLLNDHLHLDDRNGIPCPYCKAGDDRFYIRTDPGPGDHAFEGPMRIRFVCREMSRRKRSGQDIDHGPLVSARQVLEDTTGIIVNADDWDHVADTMPALFRRSHHSKGAPITYKTYKQEELTEFYLAGREEWKKYSCFDDITIGAFRLGIKQWRNGVERLTIPIQLPVTHAQEIRFALKGRRIRPHDSLPQKYDAPHGMDPYLFEKWADRDGNTLERVDTIHIAEGEKSTMAIWQMGFTPVATTTAGSNVWEDDWTRYLLAHGIKQVRLYGDDDAAGDDFVRMVRKSFLRVQNEFPEIDTLSIKAIAWPNFGDAADRSKQDPYDILEQYGPNAGPVIDKMLSGADDLIEPKVGLMFTPTGPVMDLATIRGDGPDSLYGRFSHFYRNYRKEFYNKEDEELDQPETGTALVDRSFAGSGKTRAAVRLVEEAALEREKKLAKRDARKEELKEEAVRILARYESGDIELTESDLVLFKRRAKAGPSERTSFLYVAPFKKSWDDIAKIREHAELWFPLEARSPDNCKFYETQAKVAAKGYTVMGRLCKGSCPFAEQCAETRGQYMQQFEELKKYPIVFLRHPHLLMRDLAKKAKMVIIDEDPHAEFMRQLIIDDDGFDSDEGLRDLLEGDFEEDQVNKVLALKAAMGLALKETKADKPDYARTGVDVLRVINETLKLSKFGVHTLQSIADGLESEVLDRLDRRTPETLLDPKTVDKAPSGYFADLIRVVVEETRQHFANVFDDPDYRWNSRLNIMNQKFVFYPMMPFPIPLKTPVIALDATGSPVKYEKSLRRSVLDNKSLVREPDTTTFVFSGSGFSISTIRKKNDTNSLPSDLLKNEWASVARLVVEEKEPISQADQEEIDALDLNSAINDALKVIQQVVVRHKNLLVVTYKALEQKLKDEMWKISVDMSLKLEWGHFRALRGSNEFENMEAVLIIGTPRPPLVETAMRLSALFYGEPLLDLSLGRVVKGYHSTGALPGTRVTMFADPRTHDFVDELEAGEIEQDLARIRPHTSGRGKYVYLLTDRPAAPWVTHIVDYRRVLEQYDMQAGAILASRLRARTISEVSRALSEHTGQNIGEGRSRKIAAYIRNPSMLHDWTEQAILPVDAHASIGDFHD